MPQDNGRTALYRLYDKEESLLYIGISRNPDVRWGQHSITKAWWPEVQRRSVEWHETRAAAAAAENGAIIAERPAHNDIHVVRAPRPRVSQDTTDHTFTTKFRLPRRMWDAYGRATARAGTDRSADLVDHVRAYVREHGDEQDLAELAAAEEELAARRARKGGRPRKETSA